MIATLNVVCKQPEGERNLVVQPLIFSKDNLNEVYAEAHKFPVLFGKRLNDMKDFLSFMLTENLSGDPEPAGLYWTIRDEAKLVGLFFMNNISLEEATVHYSFFDRRHKGRETLVNEMLSYVFQRFQFIRVNVQIPAYAGMGPRKFIERCGFRIEGRKRKGCYYQGDRFDVHCYGLLREEL